MSVIEILFRVVTSAWLECSVSVLWVVILTFSVFSFSEELPRAVVSSFLVGSV